MCPECGEDRGHQLKRHLRDVHSYTTHLLEELKSDRRMEKTSGSGKAVHTCTNCDLVYSTRRALKPNEVKKHSAESDLEAPIECPVCSHRVKVSQSASLRRSQLYRTA